MPGDNGTKYCEGLVGPSENSIATRKPLPRPPDELKKIGRRGIEILVNDVPRKNIDMTYSIPRLFFKNLWKGIIRGKPIKGFKLGLIKIVGSFFYKNSECGRAILDNPGGWQALDLFYLNKPKTPMDKWIQNLPAVKGTRQRKDAYKSFIKESLEELYGTVGLIKMLELCSGPGRVVLEALSELREKGMGLRNISLSCIDIDGSAIAEGRRVAKNMGLSYVTSFLEMNVRKVSHHFSRQRFHIIGTHGYADYPTNVNLPKIIRSIGSLQKPGDVLATTNMLPHGDRKARFCMHTFGGWNTIKYRLPYLYIDLMEKSRIYTTEETLIATDKGINPLEIYEEPTFYPYGEMPIHLVNKARRIEKIILTDGQPDQDEQPV